MKPGPLNSVSSMLPLHRKTVRKSPVGNNYGSYILKYCNQCKNISGRIIVSNSFHNPWPYKFHNCRGIRLNASPLLSPQNSNDVFHSITFTFSTCDASSCIPLSILDFLYHFKSINDRSVSTHAENHSDQTAFETYTLKFPVKLL